MNKLISLLLIILLTTSCAKEKKYADDLKGKKENLTDLKLEQKETSEKIAALEKEIEKLDPKKEIDPINISVRKVESTTFQSYSNIQASVIGDDIVSASSSMGGRILSMTVREGDYVKKGAFIASIDVETMDKQISEIQTSLELATTVYQRQKRLWDQNIGSEIQYLEAKNNKERIEKSLETLRSQIAKKNVYAPISGYIDREFLKQGEMASPGMPIVQILNTSKVKVVADVPENFLGKIKRGDMVEIFFPAIDKTITKKISMMGRSIDPSNRTFKIEIAVPSSGNLKPNLLADVKVKDFEAENVIAIPVQLVKQEVNGKKYVFTAKEIQGKVLAKKKYVMTGKSDNDKIIIEDGLSVDDLVIEDGSEKVTENDLLKILKTETSEDDQ